MITEARTPLARLRGMAFTDRSRLPDRFALHLPRTRSVHTFGMRFALDLIWLDAAGAVVRVDENVPPRRHRGCLRARSVIETSAGDGAGLAARLLEPVGPDQHLGHGGEQVLGDLLRQLEA